MIVAPWQTFTTRWPRGRPNNGPKIWREVLERDAEFTAKQKGRVTLEPGERARKTIKFAKKGGETGKEETGKGRGGANKERTVGEEIASDKHR